MMPDKKTYKTIITQMGFYRFNKDHTQDELDRIAKNIPITTMQRAGEFAEYCRDNKLSSMDCSILLQWVFSQQLFVDNITAKDGITFQQALDSYEPVRVSTIVLHRVNYILHECMCTVYNLVDKRLRFEKRKAQKNAEEYWDKNLDSRQRMIAHTSFVTMLDHLRLTNDAIAPYIDNVYKSIRDLMIYLEYKDVEVKARCMVVFFMAKVAGHTREAFFRDFEKEYGVNYKDCFKGDDMQPMVEFFAQMCELIGISVEKDEYGYYTLKSFNPENYPMFKKAWRDIIAALRDDDLMDETAQQAIGLNPAIQEDYQRVVKEETERREREEAEEKERLMKEKINLLGKKYKVKGL